VPLDEDTVRRDTHAPSDVVPVPAAAASPPRHSSAGAEDTEHVTVDERLWSTIEALFDLVKRQEAIRVEQDEHRQQLRTIGAAIQRFERASARVEYNAARLETSMNASPFRRLHEAVDSMQLLADNSITQVIASAERFDNLNLGNVLTRLEKTADLFSRVSGPMNATSTGVSEHMPNMVVPDLVEKVDNLTAKVDSWATSVSDGVECQVKLLKDNVRVVIGRTGMMDERLTKLEDTMSSINSNLAALVSRLDAGGVTDGPLNTATVTPISSIASADATAPVNPSTAGPASREDASGDTEMRPAQPSAQMQVELIPEQWDEIQGIQIAALSAASGLEALEQKVNYLCTWTEDNTMHTPLAVIAADIGEIRSLMEVRTYGSSATSYSAPTVVRPAVTSPITAPTPRIDLPPASPVRSQEPTLLPPPPAAPPARPPPARPPPSKPVPPPPDVAIVTLASGKKKKRRAKSATPKPGDGDATPAPEPLPAPYQNLAPEPEPPGSGPSRFLASSSAPINNRWDRVSEMLKPVGFEMSNVSVGSPTRTDIQERGSAADNETARPQDKGKQKMTWEELQREQRGLSDKGWDWW